MADISESLGDRLRRAMKAKGAGNSRVATVLGVHPGTVSQWLNDRFPPSDENLDHLASFLGVTAAWLRYGDNGRADSVRERAAVYDTTPSPISQVAFVSATTQQRARVWLEQFLAELAEEGATGDFIDSSRRLLLNSQNYEHGFGAAAGHRDEMDDEQKLRHMQGLAVGIRAILKTRTRRPPLRGR